MLRSLYIQNYALIEKLDITFNEGFSVITGETGAGKSIILGAIGLLLGQRADTKAIRQGASKCIIEARFGISSYHLQDFFQENEIDYENECIIRRELYVSGKSRAFINDTPVALPLLKELGEQLIDVHSQHQNLLLNKEDFQLGVLDIIAGNEQLIEMYRHTYKEWKNLEKELRNITEEAQKSKTDEDYIRFQLEQLEAARLTEGEQEVLEQEADTLNHAEEIKGSLYKVDQHLCGEDGGIVGALKESLNILNNISSVYLNAVELGQRMESCYIELKDMALEVGKSMEEVEFNPNRLEEVNQRLNLIYSLQQKHHVQTVEELIRLEEEYTNRLSEIISYDDRIAEITEKRDTLYKQVKEQAAGLTIRRSKAALEVEKQMVESLIPLGMPNIRFTVEMNIKNEPGNSGEDAVVFLFSANKNGALQNISSIASGGEIARVMLSVKAIIARAAQLPTIVFDEIDTGVSGEIADRMADIMQQMAKQDRQVISITHLPQIAARGQAHYLVYKRDNETETNSHIRRLSNEERIAELAQMLSGATLTEAALNNAKELLNRGNRL